MARTIRPLDAKIEMVPIANIKNVFDVRVSLDEDRVIQFAGLYEGGVALPPVMLQKLAEDEYAYIDGRTRGAAREYLNLKDVPAIVQNGIPDYLQLYATALKSNWGGAKPPSREDISHTALRMLELGASRKAIREHFEFLPSGAAMAYIAQAMSVLARRRLSKALDAIADGVSIERAAKEQGVKADYLKNVVTGKKGTWGKSRTNEQQITVEFKRHIARSLRAANGSIGMKLAALFQQVESGDISTKAADGIIKSWAEHLRQTTIRIKDWQSRLESISTEQDRASMVKLEE